jgi:hypothetical protein
MLLSSWLNLLMIAMPLGIASYVCGWGDVPTFVLVSARAGAAGREGGGRALGQRRQPRVVAWVLAALACSSRGLCLPA